LLFPDERTKRSDVWKRDELREQFYGYYAKYIETKERKSSLSLWLYALYCRRKLKEVAPYMNKEPDPEEKVMQQLFYKLLTNEKVTKLYSDVLNDSDRLPFTEEL
jgi:hypothetical protein